MQRFKRKMKVLFIIGVIFMFTGECLCDNFEEIYAKVVTSCSDEQGVSKEKMERIMNKDDLPEDDNEFITFYDCLMLGIKMYDQNDEVHFERIPDVAPVYLEKRFGPNLSKDLVQEAFEYCNKENRAKPRALEAIKRRNCGLVYVKSIKNKITKH